MKKGKKRFVAKGDRLNWVPLKELQPLKLSLMQVSGRVLTTEDLGSRHIQEASTILVP